MSFLVPYARVDGLIVRESAFELIMLVDPQKTGVGAICPGVSGIGVDRA